MVKASGGDAWQAKLDAIGDKLMTARGVKVGFLENAKYPDGKPVALIAAIQEFGAPNKNIPPRPYFRGMIAEKRNEWPLAIARLFIANKYDARATLAQTGAAIKGQLQEAISKFAGTPLSPRTIAKKGHAKQLVDTGHMLRSVDYEVEE